MYIGREGAALVGDNHDDKDYDPDHDYNKFKGQPTLKAHSTRLAPQDPASHSQSASAPMGSSRMAPLYDSSITK